MPLPESKQSTTGEPKAGPKTPRRAADAEADWVHSPRAPRPIGPEKLRALREAIESGTYPTEADVMGGLVRIFRPKPPADPKA